LGVGSQAGETETQENFMAFQVADMSIQLIEVLAPLMPRIKQRDKSRADHLSRAASSVALNLGEARCPTRATGGLGCIRRRAERTRRLRGYGSRSLGAISRPKPTIMIDDQPPAEWRLCWCVHPFNIASIETET